MMWGAFPAVLLEMCLCWASVSAPTDEAREARFVDSPCPPYSTGEPGTATKGGVGHDFDNMLSIIQGYTDMAFDQVAPALPLYADLQEIQKAAERSANRTRQLLAFASRETAAPTETPLGRGTTALLVEDEPAIRVRETLDESP